jgi:hypothetical protein
VVGGLTDRLCTLYLMSGGDSREVRMTRGKGKNEEDECIDQVQSEVQRGRVPTYIGGASPINDRDVYVRKWEVISNRYGHCISRGFEVCG